MQRELKPKKLSMVGRKENSYYLNKLGGRSWKLGRQRPCFQQGCTHFEGMIARILLSHKQVGTPNLCCLI